MFSPPPAQAPHRLPRGRGKPSGWYRFTLNASRLTFHTPRSTFFLSPSGELEGGLTFYYSSVPAALPSSVRRTPLSSMVM